MVGMTPEEERRFKGLIVRTRLAGGEPDPTQWREWTTNGAEAYVPWTHQMVSTPTPTAYMDLWERVLDRRDDPATAGSSRAWLGIRR